MPYYVDNKEFYVKYLGETLTQGDSGNFRWSRQWLIHTGVIRNSTGANLVQLPNIGLADAVLYAAIGWCASKPCVSPIPNNTKSVVSTSGSYSFTYIIGARVPGSSYVVSDYSMVAEGSENFRLTVNYRQVVPVDAFSCVYLDAEGILLRGESLYAYDVSNPSVPIEAPVTVSYKGNTQMASVNNRAYTAHKVTITGITPASPVNIVNIAGTVNNVNFDIYGPSRLLCERARFTEIPVVVATSFPPTIGAGVLRYATLECITTTTTTGVSTGEIDAFIAYVDPATGMVPSDATVYLTGNPAVGGIRKMGLAPYGEWDIFLP